MSDNLEQFIRDNRSQFDDKEPSDKVWPGIQRKLKPGRYQWYWKVAAVFFFCTSAFLFFQNRTEKADSIVAQKEKISSDFADIESFYFQMITEKRSLIESYDDDDDFDYGFEQDLQNLDAMYEVLKDELKTNPSKKVVDALLLNLVIRIDILNKELEELEETQKPEPKKEVEV